MSSRLPAKEVAKNLALSTDMTLAQASNVVRLVGKSLTLEELRRLQKFAEIICHGRHSDTELTMTKLLTHGLVAIR